MTFSEAELNEMKAKILVWMKNPRKLKAWLTKRRLLHVLIADKLALSPPGSRSGLVVASQASQRFLDMSDGILAAMAGQEDEEEESANAQARKRPRVEGRSRSKRQHEVEDDED